MQLRIQLTDLSAVPGFLDAAGDAAPVLNAERVAQIYSFLPADTAFTLADDHLVIARPDPAKKRLDEAAEFFERASKRARRRSRQGDPSIRTRPGH